MLLLFILIEPLISNDVSWFWNLDGVKIHKPKEWPQKLRQCDIDGFKLTNYIAEGAEGRVFRAENDSGEVVAVKFFKDEESWEKEHMFLDKFNLLKPKSKVLVHRILGTPTKCCDGGIHCLVEEFVNGETLSGIMTRNGLDSCDSELIENCETKLKPLDVKLVQQWILHALVGHRDMEIAETANSDQNLRNILWDKENQQIKFVDMGCARKQTFWDSHTFNFQNVANLKKPLLIPQDWAYLGLFFPEESERKEYWKFLKEIKTKPTAQKALDFAVQKNGYLNEISKATNLYLTAPHFENPNPTHPNNPTDPNPTHPDDSTNFTHDTNNFDYAPYLWVGGAFLLIVGTMIAFFIFDKRNTTQQTSSSEV